MSLQLEWMQQSEDDIARFAACFERNQSPKDLAALRWQYIQNPAGGPIVAFSRDAEMVHGDQIAAVYAVFPVRFKLDEQLVVGAQSLDTLTDGNYRGQGLFGKLATAVYDRCRETGVKFVYGFPNGSSAPGFFGKLGWVRMDPLPFLILPLRSKYFLSKLPVLRKMPALLPDFPLRRKRMPRPTVNIRPIDRFDPATEQVWVDFSKSFRIGICRDALYLNWRFFSRPNSPYTCLGSFDEQGKLNAFVVYCVREKHEGKIGYIMELMFARGCESQALDCLRHALNAQQDAGCDAVLAWNLPRSANAGVYAQGGFMVLPERFRPIELHFGAVPFDPASQAAITDRNAWYISYADSDTV
jgi:GNAT superfamily N-acetyltransferase